MAIRISSYFLFIMLLLSALVVGAMGEESVQLFGATDSRGRVVYAAYAYYPAETELRVRLTLDNRMVKSGLYRNVEVIKHLLTLLSSRSDQHLFCTYQGNAILAVFTEHKR